MHRVAASLLASAAVVTTAAASAGDAMSWRGTAILLAVGVVAAASTGLGVAIRRRHGSTRRRVGPGPSQEIEVSPDVAAALERRTLRRGRLRLSEDAAGACPDPGANAGD